MKKSCNNIFENIQLHTQFEISTNCMWNSVRFINGSLLYTFLSHKRMKFHDRNFIARLE